MKRCSKCGEYKVFDQFYKRAERKSGLRSRCKDCDRAYSNVYRAENLDKVLVSIAAWRTANTGHTRAYSAAYSANNRDKINTSARTKYHSNSAFRLACLLRGRLNKAIKRKQKRGSAVKLLGCSVDELLVHLEGKFAAGMSWANWGKWHIDHIRPLASFNLEDPTQLAVACHYTNLKPLWAKENWGKSKKHIEIAPAQARSAAVMRQAIASIEA